MMKWTVITCLLFVLDEIKQCYPADSVKFTDQHSGADNPHDRGQDEGVSDTECAITLKVPLSSLQASCPKRAPHTSEPSTETMNTVKQQCGQQIKEVEKTLKRTLFHEASVRLELEQRLLHMENITGWLAKGFKDRDLPNKKVLQHLLNRLHLEKLAREELQVQMEEMKEELQFFQKMIDCEYVRRPGVYHIQPLTLSRSIKVACDRGWTVIQRRTNGKVDFYQNWQSYQAGFGDLDGEFWLGNDNIHYISTQGQYRLLIEMTDWEGEKYYSEYDSFWIDDSKENYRLHVSGHHGNTNDGLVRKGSRYNHDKMPFSTFDRNNQPNKTSYCAEVYHGAWWYNSCYASNLNGRYCNPGNSSDLPQCMVWWGGSQESRVVMKTVTMKIRESPENILFLQEVDED